MRFAIYLTPLEQAVGLNLKALNLDAMNFKALDLKV